MTPTRKPTHPRLAPFLYLAALSALSLPAQITPQDPSAATPTPRPYIPYINRNLILLDPAHGGTDDGAHIGEHLLEKDLTLTLASRIRALLAAANLNVLSTRETDATSTPIDPLTPAQSNDSRAGVANHAHPSACILLHATGSGAGVHVITSDLPALDPSDLASLTPSRPIPWESAQETYITQSSHLADILVTSLTRAGLPVHLTRASVSPINSLICPAVAIEVAPLGAVPAEISDPTYQGRVAQAIATALLFWRTQSDPGPAPSPTPRSPRPGIQTNPQPRPQNTPRPNPHPGPSTGGAAAPERPASPPNPPAKRPHLPASSTDSMPPAPIVRRPPSAAPVLRPSTSPADPSSAPGAAR